MYSRLTKILATSLALGLLSIILFFISVFVQSGWVFWTAASAGLVSLFLCSALLERAVKVGGMIDVYQELTDTQILALDNLQREMCDPEWTARKLDEAYPASAGILYDLEHDTANGAWHIKGSLYSDGFMSARGHEAPQSSDRGDKENAHENA